MFKITNEWLMENRTKKGGWTKKQAEILGLSWPFKSGWKKKVIGNYIDNKDRVNFMSAAGVTCKNNFASDRELLHLLTRRKVRDKPNDKNKLPTALELIRCGISSNYSGKYFDDVCDLVLKPILDYVDENTSD